MRLICSSFLFSVFSALVIASEESDIQLKPSLTECKRISPCGATISTYPLLEPDAEESSGFGSGAAPPVYDEILTHEIYDLNATPELHNSTLCSCPGDTVCDFESDSNVVKVDYHVTLRFCNLETISTVCKRYDVNVRVIGAAQASGDSVQEVSQAMMFCNCPNGFSRQPIEVWSGQDISLNYKCL